MFDAFAHRFEQVHVFAFVPTGQTSNMICENVNGATWSKTSGLVMYKTAITMGKTSNSKVG